MYRVKAFGAVGLITSGAAGDLDQVEALNFPCFTNGTICPRALPYPPGHVPVHVGGIMVLPATCCTVTATASRPSPSTSPPVAHACPEFMEAEAVVLAYLQSPRVDIKGYAAAPRPVQRRR